MKEAVKEQTVTFTVNGENRTVTVHPLTRLLDVLREELGLTGTKEGCGEGECGACTVLLDGSPVTSCTVPVCQVEGAEVTTIEGLGKDGRLSVVQEAFQREGATQCGICTPGMVVSTTYYLEHPEAAENIREALAGNQCRCTGYKRIFDAVEEAFDNK